MRAHRAVQERARPVDFLLLLFLHEVLSVDALPLLLGPLGLTEFPSPRCCWIQSQIHNCSIQLKRWGKRSCEEGGPKEDSATASTRLSIAMHLL